MSFASGCSAALPLSLPFFFSSFFSRSVHIEVLRLPSGFLFWILNSLPAAADRLDNRTDDPIPPRASKQGAHMHSTAAASTEHDTYHSFWGYSISVPVSLIVGGRLSCLFDERLGGGVALARTLVSQNKHNLTDSYGL